MLHSRFDEFVAEFTQEMEATLEVKGEDYASDVDRLSNFKQVANNLDIPALQVWAVYAAKHFIAVSKYAKDGIAASEPIHGRFIDLANYAVLGAALAAEHEDA